MKANSIIYRDDDISQFTKMDQFKKVHVLFDKYRVDHTIAVIANGIEKHTELVDYVLSKKNIKVQLHCWDHDPLPEKDPEELSNELSKAMDRIEQVFGVVPTILYPPWNRSSEMVETVAGYLGLQVSTEKISLSAYIRAGGQVSETVVNFHSWAESEAILIEPALKIYTRKSNKNICE